MILVPELIPFDFSLIHHLEKERERAWNNQKQETLHGNGWRYDLICIFRILLITCVSFVVCNITG